MEKENKPTLSESAADNPAVTDTPVENHPAENPHAEKTPAESSPSENALSEKAPAENTSSEKAPSENTPAEKAPAENTSSEKAPSENTPAEKAPSENTPAEKAPSENTPAEKAPSEQISPAVPPLSQTATGDTSVEEASADNKPKNKWGRFLLIWAAILLAVGLFGCVKLYRYLEIYEVTRPEQMMDELMANMSAEDWLDAAAENLDFTVGDFEDAEALFAGYRASLPLDQPLSYRSSKKDTNADRAVFVVRSGARNYCWVELVPGEETYDYARHDWQLGSISSGDILQYLQSASVSITALAGQPVFLNGIRLEEDYLTDEGIPVDNLQPLEKRMKDPPSLVRYTVDPLYGEIQVTDADGKELAPTVEKGGSKLSYNASPIGTHALSISAPEDVTVSVNGVTLRPEDALSSSLDILSGLVGYMGGEEYETLLYSFDGLYLEPSVTAKDAGGKTLNSLWTDGTHYSFYHSSDKATVEELLPVAEDYFNEYISYTGSPFSYKAYYHLLDKTLHGTELYKYIADSQQTMLWAANTTMEYEQLSFDNFSYLGKNCFLCTVQFSVDTTASTWVEEHHYGQENVIALLFIKEVGIWKAAVMSIVSQ